MTAMSMEADLRCDGNGWSLLQHPPGAMRAVLAIGAAAVHRVGAERCTAAEAQPDVEVAVRGGCCKWAMRGHGYGCRGVWVGCCRLEVEENDSSPKWIEYRFECPAFFLSKIGRYEK